MAAALGKLERLLGQARSSRVTHSNGDLRSDKACVVVRDRGSVTECSDGVGFGAAGVAAEDQHRRQPGSRPRREDREPLGRIEASPEGRVGAIDISGSETGRAKSLQGRGRPLPVAQAPGDRQGGLGASSRLLPSPQRCKRLASEPQAVCLALRMAERTLKLQCILGPR